MHISWCHVCIAEHMVEVESDFKKKTTDAVRAAW